MSNFVMIRLTPTFSDENAEASPYLRFLKYFATTHEAQQYTMGVETKDKFGNETHKHIHLSFMTEKEAKKDSYQKSFRNKFKERFGYTVTGNKMYSIKIEVDPENEERFMRYPLKQQLVLKKYMYFKYTDEEAEKLRMLAHDEYNRTVKTNCEGLDKYLDKSSFKGKCYAELKKKEIKKKKQFIINFVKYYLEKNKVPPFSKLDDYWVDYQLQIGIMTVENWYNSVYEE